MDALQLALADPGVNEKLGKLGTITVARQRATPAALDAHLKAETARWAPSSATPA